HDHHIVKQVEEACQWILDVRQQGSTWDLTKSPLPRKELYPNMSNHHDAPWRDVKKLLAIDLKEITALWMCGPRERRIAHQNGIFKWVDCSAATVGINGPKRSRILNAIIEVNKRRNRLAKVHPPEIKCNLRRWQTPGPIEFFVDFEIINDIHPDFTTL